LVCIGRFAYARGATGSVGETTTETLGEARPSSRRPWVEPSLGLRSLMREPFLPAFRFSFAYLDWGRALDRKHRHQAAATMTRPTGTRTDGTTVCIAVSELISSAAGVAEPMQPLGPAPLQPAGPQDASQAAHVVSTDPEHTTDAYSPVGHRVHGAQTIAESTK